jgi:hypothetical protein
MKKKRNPHREQENLALGGWMCRIHGLSARVFYSWDEDGWRQIIINRVFKVGALGFGGVITYTFTLAVFFFSVVPFCYIALERHSWTKNTTKDISEHTIKTAAPRAILLQTNKTDVSLDIHEN